MSDLELFQDRQSEIVKRLERENRLLKEQNEKIKKRVKKIRRFYFFKIQRLCCISIVQIALSYINKLSDFFH